MSSVPYDDEHLMVAYVAGDREAHRELFRRYAPVLRGTMLRATGNASDAEDLVQDTFLQLHRARHDYRLGSPVRPWLMTIALNLKRDLLRRRGRRKEGTLDLDGRHDPANGRSEARATARKDVHAALGELSEGMRDVVELHWFAGLSFPEVAAVLGIGTAAAKVRAHRAYEQLRSRLGTGV